MVWDYSVIVKMDAIGRKTYDITIYNGEFLQLLKDRKIVDSELQLNKSVLLEESPYANLLSIVEEIPLYNGYYKAICDPMYVVK